MGKKCEAHGIEDCTFCNPEIEIRDKEVRFLLPHKTADDIIKEVDKWFKNFFNKNNQTNDEQI